MSGDTVYLRPTNLDDALEALATSALTIAAGCTDLLAATERKRLPGPVLDITAIADLRGVTATPNGVRIGATTTWSDIIAADLPPACDGLKRASHDVGARQVQNRGTIAGNLCNASPAADGVPPLLTLDAAVELASVEGVRQVPLADFIVGPRQVVKTDTELVTAIHIPERSLLGQGGFAKLGARTYLVISIAMTAVRVETSSDGKITKAAVSVGACGPIATRLPGVEAALTGQVLQDAVIDADDVAAALSPIADVRADAAYRTDAAVELLRRSLRSLARPTERAA